MSERNFLNLGHRDRIIRDPDSNDPIDSDPDKGPTIDPDFEETVAEPCEQPHQPWHVPGIGRSL